MNYKGFDKDLKCRNFQYEIGKEYEEEKAIACETGFHACEYPLDVLGYYAPADSRYCEVEQSGELSTNDEDSKVASTKIKIGAEIGIPGLVKASIDYITEKAEPSKSNHSKRKQSANSATGDRSANSATGNWSANSATGNWSANSATGYRSANSATGNWSANSATGDRSANSATGYRSANSATGYRSANSATGDWSANSATGYGSANISTGFECNNYAGHETSIAVGWGVNNKCKGVKGAYIVCTEWVKNSNMDYGYKLLEAKMTQVDGEIIKENVFYTLRNGEFVEVE